MLLITFVPATSKNNMKPCPWCGDRLCAGDASSCKY